MQRVAGAVLTLCAAFQIRAETIAVIPFFNLSGSQSLDWIGESLAENIRESLASKGLLVIERDSREEVFRSLSIRRYAQLTKASVLKIGESLEADKLVYGAFESSAPAQENSSSHRTLDITVHVLDRVRLTVGPSFQEKGALEDLAALQERLAWQTLRYLDPGATPAEEEFRKERKPVRLDAMENYIRGLLAQTMDQKHRFFTQAARLDETFSQPRFQLGKLHWRKRDYRVAAGWLEKVTPDDAHFREATFLLGLCRYYMGDYQDAAESFEGLAESVPLDEVWNNLGAAQSRLNVPDALASFRRALDGDPDDPVYAFNVGYSLWRRGQYAEAAERFRAVLDRNPTDPVAMTMLGRCLKKSGPGRLEARVEALERLKHTYREMAYRRSQAELAAAQGRPAAR